ncbi:MogA/MoaB family molybdenum cofactor biosynthesis protein [Ruminococcaceae bacterium OttesenSCG-928-I18]|nr:MogA/MoaB family molybdenum cofactor biosynthesis protein [Ruminococcaceae bacterium OttesenSCG-928-I18]
MWNTPYRVAVLTASDKGAKGERIDESGPLLKKKMEALGCVVTDTRLLPDDQAAISSQLQTWSEDDSADLILTTGGTGLSPRDCTPEATLSVAHRQVPGISEAMRARSLSITPRGMLSRGVSALCHNTLIINLPGSPKAAEESLDAVLPVLEHALDTLRGNTGDCARTT